ncbi:MAG: 2-dehydropantoate 2-reductase [Gammaproteobacteria bacterium]|nr:2-dehydropantoate 2-reductase [Gammaproteobacteria bacterium]MBT8151463.1 2-dehydropantoate 2-reductase [Gammaproteobacteria bacterium]NND38759.1 2-dehydropantoate 2-reductase [Pseudomonadales bacterium]NNM10389.1 2-dehydropantoate 2-reductase [Pseudomonadales bacterium]RZV57325.1 MAG: 2-dehydropantoate 2-reductase [Pseudomonadales bacterium]
MQDSLEQDRRWYILGPGAIGCLWASLLTQAGAEVVLIGKSGASVMINLHYRPDVSLQKGTGRSLAPGEYRMLRSSADALGSNKKQISQMLIATKAQDANSALGAVVEHLSPNATVISLCNGIGFHESLARKLMARHPQRRFFVAVSSEAAMLEAPLSVLHTGRGITRVGQYAGKTENIGIHQHTDKLLNLLHLPAQLGIHCEYDADINRAVLQKAFINCVINPLTALLRCRNGELLSNAGHNARFAALCSELQPLYDAMYNQQQPAPAKQAIQHDKKPFDLKQSASKVAQVTAANQSSMLKDRLAGRQLELEALNIYIEKAARDLEMPCPLNSALIQKLLHEPPCVKRI